MRPGPFPAANRRRQPPEGTLEVFAADEQDAQPVDVARWARLAEAVLGAQGVRGDAELSLLFVDRLAMAELHRRFLDGDGPTDVLSFPIEEDVVELGRWPDASTTGPDRSPTEADEAPLLLGDVVICPAVAAENAPHHAGSYEDELALLVVHGVLHVLGLDHADPAETTTMQGLERDLLARFHGPLSGEPWAPSPPPPSSP
jgi:probable rRNA maturation factor